MIRQMACSLKLPRKSHLSVIPVCQGQRKQFYIGQAESVDTFEYMEKCSYPYRHTSYLYCAKHNQHARHADARESGGIPPVHFKKQAL